MFGLQYNDVLEMLESFERMYLMSVYRKYRPDVPLHKHAKTWYVLSKKKIHDIVIYRKHRPDVSLHTNVVMLKLGKNELKYLQ